MKLAGLEELGSWKQEAAEGRRADMGCS